MDNEPKSGSSGTEIDPKIAGMLSYLGWLVTGIIFYSISKDSYVRFHAMQSIFLSIACAILYFVIFILGIFIPFLFFLYWLISLAIFALWIVMMVKAYQGEKFKLPIIGDLAEQYTK